MSNLAPNLNSVRNSKVCLSGKVPIVVGVTGHRDLHEEDWPALRTAFRARLLELLTKYPETPMVLLTALAPGADRLAAECALELGRQPGLDHRIHVVSPVPEVPLAAGGGASSGDRLLSYDVRSQDGYVPIALANDESEPHRQLAAYLVRNSHVLVAFLSEREVVSDPPDGGTATVVHWAENGLDPIYNPGAAEFDLPEALLVLRIPVRRKSDACSRAPAVASWSIEEEIQQQREEVRQCRFDEVFSRFEIYNSDVARFGPRNDAAIAKAKAELLGEGQPTPSELETLAGVFAAADVISLDEFKRRTRLHAASLLWMTLIAVVGFESFAHFHVLERVSLPEWPSLLLYISVLGVAFGLHRYYFERKRIEERSLVYRSLAEALRLQAAWKYGNIRAIVSNHYARYFRSEVEWVRHAVRGLFASLPPMTERNSEDVERRRRGLLKHWIIGQCTFFRDSREELEKRIASIRRRSRLCVGFAFALAALLVLARSLLTQESVSSEIQHIATGLIVVAMAYAALSREHARFSNVAALVRRYGIQQEIFERVHDRLAAALAEHRADAAERILRDLGIEVLTENCSWLLLQRDRPLEIIPH